MVTFCLVERTTLTKGARPFRLTATFIDAGVPMNLPIVLSTVLMMAAMSMLMRVFARVWAAALYRELA